jgi:hypothetical protein
MALENKQRRFAAGDHVTLLQDHLRVYGATVDEGATVANQVTQVQFTTQHEKLTQHPHHTGVIDNDMGIGRTTKGRQKMLVNIDIIPRYEKVMEPKVHEVNLLKIYFLWIWAL